MPKVKGFPPFPYTKEGVKDAAKAKKDKLKDKSKKK